MFFNGEILANFDLDHESRLSTPKVEKGGFILAKTFKSTCVPCLLHKKKTC
jgi:hypothetical protein